MKIGAFHSPRHGTTRHHNNNRCPEGNLIISTDRIRGRGGYPLCERCAKLAAEAGMGGAVAPHRGM